MKNSNKKLLLLLSIGIILSSCMANLRPSIVKKNPNSVKLEEKGKEILAKTYLAHGVAQLEKHEVYQFTATDDWKGMMAGMGKLWPQKNSKMTFKYVPNTFDSQVTFEDGKTTNQTAGIQSWEYYEKDSIGNVNFDVKSNKRYVFGMSAFQYFTELVGRLSNAEIIRYGGEKTFNGTNYELIYVTWKSEKANKDVDQYLLYVNKETSMLEYASYTLRDNYLKMPGSRSLYGSIGFSDFNSIDGFMVPFTQSIFIMAPKKKNKKYLHQLVIESFSFDEFDKSELYPNDKIEAIGDSKL